jgi:hypothetical protein
MSYVELYNNTFRNLIDWGLVEPQKEQNSKSEDELFRAARSDRIEVRENKVAGVHLSGPGLRAPVTSAESVLRLVEQGNQCRAVGVTNCNEHSSRSHAILTLYVESRTGTETSAEVGLKYSLIRFLKRR